MGPAPVPAKLRAALAEMPLDRLRVLEPASGPGRYLRHFGPGSRGLDHAPEVVAASSEVLGQAAAERDLAVELVDLDAPGWSRDRGGFEAAWVNDVLCHVADPRSVLAELRACLVPGAPVVVVEWTRPARGPALGLRDALAGAVPGARATWSDPDHRRVLRADEVEELCADVGLELVARRLHTFTGRPGGRLAAALTHTFWPVRSWHLRR